MIFGKMDMRPAVNSTLRHGWLFKFFCISSDASAISLHAVLCLDQFFTWHSLEQINRQIYLTNVYEIDYLIEYNFAICKVITWNKGLEKKPLLNKTLYYYKKDRE